MAVDPQKEVRELRTELTRLKERVDRLAWGNPHDIAYRALSAVELVRDYYASSAPGVEMIRQIVEMLRGTAAGRVGSPSAGVGAAFIYGLAELIEGVYLGNRYNEEVHAFANRRRIEEEHRSRTEEGERA